MGVIKASKGVGIAMNGLLDEPGFMVRGFGKNGRDSLITTFIKTEVLRYFCSGFSTRDPLNTHLLKIYLG
jgi:hypothetical protein